MNVTYTATTKFSDQQIADLLCGAFEGGSNYWIEAISYTKPKVEKPTEVDGEIYPSYISYPFHEGGVVHIFVDDEDDHASARVLNREKLQAGLQLMADKSPHHFADFLAGNDDATTADVFLQYCVFGEIIYG